MASSVLDQNIQIIKNLLDQNNLFEAHKACLEILRIDPENLRCIRLKNKIEKKIRKNNKAILKKEIHGLKPLWREKKYGEYLEKIKPLLAYRNDYPKITKIALKAEKAYRKQQSQEQSDYLSQAFHQIDQLKNEKKYADALEILNKVKIYYYKERKFKNYEEKFLQEYFQEKLKHNESLLQSQKYEEILMFYYGLKKEFPKIKQIENLIKKTKNDYEAYKREEKKEFIYNGLGQIRTLLQLKKPEKAIEAAKEILNIDPHNQKALDFLKKAQIKAQHQIEKEVIVQMLEAHKKLQLEFKQNRSLYKKI